MGIQLAKAVTGSKIISMDLDDEKLRAAKENGADNTNLFKKRRPIKGSCGAD
jgi:alcohol dehydrogenase, propanol-preferring